MSSNFITIKSKSDNVIFVNQIESFSPCLIRTKAYSYRYGREVPDGNYKVIGISGKEYIVGKDELIKVGLI